MAEMERDRESGLLLPVPGAVITQLYGPENTDPEVQHLYRKGYHTGIDFSGVPEGTPVLSPAEGTVVIAGQNAGYGECVVLRRDDGSEVLFGHLSSIAVQVGERIAPGQEIGGIGNTGVSTGVHLHLEYREDGVDADPTPMLADGSAAAPAGPRATVTAAVNFRAAPGDDAEILATAPAGSVVTLRRGGWYPVWWEGRSGWMWGSYLQMEGAAATPEQSETPALVPDPPLTTTESPAGTSETLPVPEETATAEQPATPSTGRTTDSANFRSGPGLDQQVLTVLPRGTPVTVTEESGEWLAVQVGDQQGYIHISLVARADQPPPARRGRTIGRPNLRGGPGAEHPVLTVLDPGLSLEVFEEQNEYLAVRVHDLDGFVHRDFVQFEEQDGHLGFFRERAGLAEAVLPPPVDQQIDAGAAGSDKERLAAATWNRYGNLLNLLSNEIKIDPAVAVAVLCVEAGGGAFGPDGRMIIRFENHIFYQQWGRDHPDTFFQHFSFSDEQSWQGHLWRASADDPWQEFHGDQAAEWKVLEFAAGLDDTAAKRSISMGAPQIMGFNCTAIGCESVQEMYDGFAASARAQIIGFFDFVAGGSATAPRVLALQRQDYLTFASLYNGSGQAGVYAGLISGMCDAFRALRP